MSVVIEDPISQCQESHFVDAKMHMTCILLICSPLLLLHAHSGSNLSVADCTYRFR